MCEPFTIRSWADPSIEYVLRDIEKFREIYEPQGFYVAGNGPHSFRRQRALAERQQRVVETFEETEGIDDIPDVQSQLQDFSRSFHQVVAGAIIERGNTWDVHIGIEDAEPTEQLPTPADASDAGNQPARHRQRPSTR